MKSHFNMDDPATKTAGTKSANGESRTNQEASPAAHSFASCCGLKSFHFRIPEDYRNETVQFLKLAGPVFISQLMSFLIGFISMVFCGHLGNTELAGVALATAVINVTGLSIGCGLAAACDTLISQTFGSGNLKRVGVILQRGILILLLACFPCWAVLINTEPILLAVRQNPNVARLSQLYVKIFMPALPAAFLFQLELKYLQNQGIIWPQVIIGVFVNVFNAIINYVFLYVLDMGVAGSAAANAISQYSLAVFLFVYIYNKGLHEATWDGWSWQCWQEWGPYMRLAFPSMLMLCLEWWLYEVAGFLAGVIGDVELGAQSIVYQLATVVYMFPVGFSVAASVRVGNALGAGNIERAKLSSKIAFICTLTVSCFIGVCLAASKDVIAYIFSTEKDIVQRVSDVMILYAFTHVAEALMSVTGGIVRGAGKQMFGAVSSLVCYYFVGLPVGVALMFSAKLGYVGLWAGFFISGLLDFTVYAVFLYNLNWEKTAEEALVRAGVKVTDENKIFVMATEVAPDCDDKRERVKSERCGPAEERLRSPGSGQTLSVRQLVMRRGLAVFIMLLVLAAGVFISEVLSRFLHLK